MTPGSSRSLSIIGPALLWILAVACDLLGWTNRLGSAALLIGVVWAALGALPALLDSWVHSGRRALGLTPRRIHWPVPVTAAFGGVLVLRSLHGPEDPLYRAAACAAVLGIAVGGSLTRWAAAALTAHTPATARGHGPFPILGRPHALTR